MTDKTNNRWNVRSLVMIVVVLCFHPVTAQLAKRDLHRLIGAEAWSPEELNDLEKGNIVVRSLGTDLKQELGSIGILRIGKLPAIPMDKFRESLSQKGSDAKKAGGRFSGSPTVEDLRTLELEPDALVHLQRCTIGKCDLNLSAKMIARFQREIDWASPNAKSDATRLISEMLVAYARDYLASGNRSLGTYDNRRKTVDLATSHRSLLSRSSLISELAPEFVEYLEKFPGSTLQNVDNSLHWSLVDFGLKPSITISHSAAYTQTKGEYQQLFIASKQLYSSRYLDSSLTFTLLLRVETETGIDAYLVFVDRSRSDALDGPLGGFARSVVQKESEDRIKTLLDKAHVRLLAAGNPRPQNDPDSDESSSLWGRTTLIIVGIMVVVGLAAFVALRRRAMV